MAFFQLDNTGEDTSISAQFSLTANSTDHDIVITNLSNAAVDIYLGQVNNVGIDPGGTTTVGRGHTSGHHPLPYRSLDVSGHNVDLKGLQAGATVVLHATVYGTPAVNWPATTTSTARSLHRTSAQDDNLVLVAPVTGANQILPLS